MAHRIEMNAIPRDLGGVMMLEQFVHRGLRKSMKVASNARARDSTAIAVFVHAGAKCILGVRLDLGFEHAEAARSSGAG